MLTQEQANKIKQQLFKQMENWPAQQAEPAKKQLEAMSPSQLEEFLIKNKLIKTTQETADSTGTECIFCLIAQGKIESFKIAESPESIAVLEINPVSQGHVIIIPKKHITDISQLQPTIINQPNQIKENLFALAIKLSKIMKKALQAKTLELFTSSKFNHIIINLIPVYKDEEAIDLPRKKAEKKNLESLKEKLKKAIEQEIEKDKKEEERQTISEHAPVRQP